MLANTRETRRIASIGYLLESIDPCALILFKAAFGILFGFHFIFELLSSAALQKFVVPVFHFKFSGVEFVPSPSEQTLTCLLVILSLSLLGLAFGRLCLLTSGIASCLMTWLLLIDASQFLNQDYLGCLICFLFVLTSCQDNPRKKERLFLVVRIFAVLSKLNFEWLSGLPYSLFNDSAWRVYVGMGACWGSLAFDLMSGPLLLIPSTKTIAIWASLFFNLTQWFTFGGVIWLVNSFALLLFLDPQLLRVELKGAFDFITEMGLLQLGDHNTKLKRKPQTTLLACLCRHPCMCVAFAFAAFQLLFPLRYLLWEGDVSWTEEGRLFSWQGITRHKFTRPGQFLCVDEISSRKIDPAKYLSRTQLRKMQAVPWMIHSFATHLNHSVVHRFGLKQPAIYGLFDASLNGQPFASIVDPKVNLLTAQTGGVFSVPSYVTHRSATHSSLNLWLVVFLFAVCVFLCSWLRWLSKSVTKRV